MTFTVSPTTNDTYTTGSLTLGGSATVRINTTTEPTLERASLISGSTFISGSDMYMKTQYFGDTVQYFFEEL